MLKELKTMFAQQVEQELLQTTRDFHSCRQEERQSVSSYVLKKKGYIDNLERLGYPVTLGLGVSLILIGLRKEYDGFVQNYNMHSMGKTVNELHAMLKLHEQTLPKSNAPALNAIRAGKVQKGLRASRKLKPGVLSLYVGNGQREAVEAIDAFYLCLPSGLEIILNNCHYAPSITRGVIFVSRLYEDSFVNRFVNNAIQVSRNNVVYFCAIPRDGIFKIDLSNSITTESSVYAVSNKRAKLDLDSALLSTRTRHAPNRMCLYIDAEEHELGDLGEPANYKAALLDPEQPIPPAPVAYAGQQVAPEILTAHTAWVKGSKEIAGLMQEEGQSVSSYVLKMKGYIDNLECLGHPVTLGLAVSLILIGLCKEYDGFVQNYNMHNMGKTVNEWHAMLKLHDQTLQKATLLLLMLFEQGLRASRKLKPGALSLYVGNGQREAVEAIGAFYSCLPSGLEIVLNNCHYAPSITRWVISVFRLYEYGFVNRFIDNAIQVSKNKVVYFCAIPRDVFKKEVENQLGKTIKSLCSNRGGEYTSQEFLEHLKGHGIIAHRTPPYTPQHNGVSERRNRTLLDMVEKTPYEVWHGKSPKLSYLKVWCCEALVKRDTLTKPDKLEPRSIKCIFVGYPKETIGYSFYQPPENKVLVARNAEFLENSLIDQEASGKDAHPSLDTSLNHEEDDLEIDEPQSDIVPIRRSTLTRHAPDRMCLYIDAEEHELGDLGEPANYKAALLDPESEKWLNAMNVEMQSMKDNEVWVLVELPTNGKTVGSKWLFKKKTDMDGNVHIYKARLMAKGFTQTPAIDYEETFSPVADIRAIRILIAIAAYYDYEI
nr:hypothetical protein [Tanacetum cinerariifolium]